ncbi:MAG: glycosyltransferase [Anaerolineales bacterium]|nr:MAG: glycosyltransferase [Anaerolineales bacterium]
MKILLVGPRWIGGWMEGVEYGLIALGHQVQAFAYSSPHAPFRMNNELILKSYVPSALHSVLRPLAHRIGAGWERDMNRRLVKTVYQYQPDLIFLLKGDLIQPETLEAIKSANRLLISWWVDNPLFYYKDYPQVAVQLKIINALFIFDYEDLEMLKQKGVENIFYLPCAYDPEIYHPKKISAPHKKRFECEVAFIANYYPERGEFLKYTQGLDVAVWGRGWKSFLKKNNFPPKVLRGKDLNGEYVSAVYNTAYICPNVHHVQSRGGGLNMRTFEIPGAGGFQLTDYIAGMEEHFEIGRELIVYESPEHFRELAEYYLKHESERKAIAHRGYERVVREHTYEQRLKKIFEVLN